MPLTSGCLIVFPPRLVYGCILCPFPLPAYPLFMYSDRSLRTLFEPVRCLSVLTLLLPYPCNAQLRLPSFDRLYPRFCITTDPSAPWLPLLDVGCCCALPTSAGLPVPCSFPLRACRGQNPSENYPVFSLVSSRIISVLSLTRYRRQIGPFDNCPCTLLNRSNTSSSSS